MPSYKITRLSHFGSGLLQPPTSNKPVAPKLPEETQLERLLNCKKRNVTPLRILTLLHHAFWPRSRLKDSRGGTLAWRSASKITFWRQKQTNKGATGMV